ncbi:MAG: flagellar export chaperone FliS [Syntrophomonadaceae bacterium]|nr:flagellar export chaperone FliS [Syntrophomonadaceae bacterium]
METNSQAYLQYRKTSIETTSPGRLLLMLLNGAIKSLNNAKIAINNNDMNKAHVSIVMVQEIVAELMSTLKMEYEISHNLMALYEYFLQQLIAANIKKDTAIIDEILDYFNQMYETWEEAVKNLGPNQAAVPNHSLKKVNISG